ncbi:MAG: flagellar regulator YcgR PilZN domain-containing protein [Methyloprofundus sp.]|nr:flagellar brake protein [Methyloprofundus sp.]MDT8426463.1 flagellar regulator YcgR PilZN domain-containing protein [Methyloprofundus sp.]
MTEEVDSIVENRNPNFVTDPTKVIHLLSAIEANTAFCTIELNNSDETYTSHIIDVQAAKQQILLDELVPDSGNKLLKQCKELKLTTFLNNIHLSIVITDISPAESLGEHYFKAPLPKRIYYPQRRNSPRIAISAYNLTFQGTSNRTNFTVGGIVCDISRNGIGLIVNSSTSRLMRGDLLKNCILTLPNELSIHFDLLIRSSKPYSNSRTKLLIGGHFDQLKSTKEQNQLEQFFALVERTQIRLKKDY